MRHIVVVYISYTTLITLKGEQMSTMGFINQTNNNNQTKQTIVPLNFTHSCAIGQTGCGKTSSYIYPNIQDRIKRGHSLMVYDYKGKEHTSVKYFASQHNRLDDVVEIGKYWGESINILKYMHSGDLEDFLTDLFALNDTENDFWGKSAVNISVAILDIIDAIEKVTDAAEQTGVVADFQKRLYAKNDYKYPTKKTLYSLSLVSASLDSLRGFVQNLDSLQNNMKNIMVEEIVNYKELPKEEVFEKFKKLAYYLQNLKHVIKDARKKLEEFGNLSSSSASKTYQTILLSVNSPLIGIAGKKSLNTDSFDIIEALENKKIIIINAQMFSEDVLASFSSSLFKEFAKRTVKKNLQPISIFVDEAQRVVSKNFDLPVDVFREAKVEFFLSFQNSELMISALGENKFEALLQNLSDRFIYKNVGYFKELDTSQLECFEYVHDGKKDAKIQQATPLFLEDDDTFKVELEYQKRLELHSMFDLDIEDREKVILHNEHGLDTLELTLIDSQGSCYKRAFYQKIILQSAKKSFYDLFEQMNDDASSDQESLKSLIEAKLAEMQSSFEIE